MIGVIQERISRIPGRPSFRRPQRKIRLIPDGPFPSRRCDIGLLFGVKFQGILVEFNGF